MWRYLTLLEQKNSMKFLWQSLELLIMLIFLFMSRPLLVLSIFLRNDVDDILFLQSN